MVNLRLDMLEAVGVNPGDERIYRLVLERPGLTLEELATLADDPAASVGASVTALEEAGLVSRSLGEPSRFTATPPEAAFEVLILRRREQLEQVRLAAANFHRTFHATLREGGQLEHVEVVSDLRMAHDRFLQLQRSAREEILGFDVPPYGGDPPDAPVEPPPLQLELLARGIRYRIVYDRTALEFPGGLATARALVRAGEEARVFDGLPMKMAVADGSIALLPRSPDDLLRGVVAVRSPSIVAMLRMLFEMVWNASHPLVPDDGARAREHGLNAEDHEVLMLLAAGLKDHTIARQLGVSRRTLERRVRRLLGALDAKTRFQAGINAARRALM